jgi:hypothetical protein
MMYNTRSVRSVPNLSGLLVAAVLLAACDRSPHPLGPDDPAFHHDVPEHVNALVERAWGANQQWELVKPRPPGVGAPQDVAVHLYIIAPVNENDPLSPGIQVDFLTVGGRDHVVPLPQGQQGSVRGLARSVPVVVPGWEFWTPPFCAPPVVDEDRIAWRWLEVSVHPCGQVPTVYAAKLEGEACRKPLTSVDRIMAAVEQDLVELDFPPEAPWPFAVRPLTAPRQGRVTITPPACV